MQLLPMHLPAELHRRMFESAGEGEMAGEVTVAKGPLVIMAYGLMAIDPEKRDGFWISSAHGDLSADATEEVLRGWNTRWRN